MDRYNEEAHEEYMRFLMSLFKSSISQCSIKLAYLTGIMPLERPLGDLSSIDLNNFDLFTMARQSRLLEYVGFTEQEVIELCRNCQKDFKEIKRRGVKDAVLQMLAGERYKIYYGDIFGDRMFGFKRQDSYWQQ